MEKKNKEYSLVKTFIEEGRTSNVATGRGTTGSVLRVIRDVTPEDIIEGDQVYVSGVNWIKTSPVKRIEKNNNGGYTMWTQTSVYSLNEEDINDNN